MAKDDERAGGAVVDLFKGATDAMEFLARFGLTMRVASRKGVYRVIVRTAAGDTFEAKSEDWRAAIVSAIRAARA